MQITDILAQMGGLQSMAREAGGERDPGGERGRGASMLDLNGDGNPLDDIMRMAGKAMR